MLLTPKEALDKFCPQTYSIEEGWTRCLNSKCMAWRQSDKYAMQNRKRVYKGYCGLAGKP